MVQRSRLAGQAPRVGRIQALHEEREAVVRRRRDGPLSLKAQQHGLGANGRENTDEETG